MQLQKSILVMSKSRQLNKSQQIKDYSRAKRVLQFKLVCIIDCQSTPQQSRKKGGEGLVLKWVYWNIGYLKSLFSYLIIFSHLSIVQYMQHFCFCSHFFVGSKVLLSCFCSVYDSNPFLLSSYFHKYHWRGSCPTRNCLLVHFSTLNRCWLELPRSNGCSPAGPLWVVDAVLLAADWQPPHWATDRTIRSLPICTLTHL